MISFRNLCIVVAIGYALVHAVALAWVSDDAFISFRYARNLVDGLGLVYNAEEPTGPVEGYTNFLWTILVALGMWCGANPIPFAHVLSVLCFAVTLGALLGSARGNAVAGVAPVVPVAVLGYAVHQQALEFATSGLETAMFTMLATLALVRLIHAGRSRHYAIVGVLLVLASMTRPDGAVFYAAATLVTAAVALRQRSFLPLVYLLAPVAICYLPYFVWKCIYYGYPFPNTFYVRSASDPYPGAGLRYVGLYLLRYPILALAFVFPVYLVVRRLRSGSTLVETGFDGSRAALALACHIFLFLGYVIWVGGDFMFARFLIPITPALYLAWQLFLQPLKPRLAWILCAAIVAATATSSLYRPLHTTGLADERSVYPAWRIQLYRDIGEGLKRHFGDTDVRVVIFGSQAMLGYFGDFPTVIERNGLTDEYIAHRKVAERGRVGHEKLIPLDDPYLSRRGAHFSFGLVFFDNLPADRIGALRNIEFRISSDAIPDREWLQRTKLEARVVTNPWRRGTILTYDRKVMDPLKGREDVRFVPFDAHLDRYLAQLDQKQPEEVRRDFEAFRRFYFDHNDDPVRQQAFERFLQGR